MSVRKSLALELVGLEVEAIQPGVPGATTLETVEFGHGMTEVTASVGVPSCSASCCLGCCCCCC
ncbi:hypothetical protein [Rhizohabitans arisaemae]|uniref:hypothetical protein n=1 Tax=Rhizohabitans arisaemae TaxID=2720610 RepID=UPI0024B25F80|nr:hypothetical protein [Rhizohabitans arisaemae]